MSGKKTAIGCLAVLAVWLLVCSGALLLSPIGRAILGLGRHMSVREYAVIPLPDGVNEVRHSRIGIHPMMAEYSRDVTFISKGALGNTTPLAVDTAGGYPINCYWIEATKGGFLRLDDAVSEHLLDPANQTTYLVVRVRDMAYVGQLIDEEANSMTLIANNDPSTISVTVGEHAAVPLADLVGDFEERFIGMITGSVGKLRFIPASEQPESPIRKLGER